jgi:pyruvate/2-oxoglutarate/acetoin dehydrogenase E1 component
MNTPIPFNLKLEEESVPQKDDIIAAVQSVLHNKVA